MCSHIFPIMAQVQSLCLKLLFMLSFVIGRTLQWNILSEAFWAFPQVPDRIFWGTVIFLPLGYRDPFSGELRQIQGRRVQIETSSELLSFMSTEMRSLTSGAC